MIHVEQTFDNKMGGIITWLFYLFLWVVSFVFADWDLLKVENVISILAGLSLLILTLMQIIEKWTDEKIFPGSGQNK